ncbi:MAG: glycerophosphodiester phosphodiesterase family protein [Bacilli bacterium]
MFNLIAHRGLVNNTQDNSLESLTNGLKSDKYKGIETDVRETLDNEFILYHNPLFKGNLVKNTSYKSFKKENIIKLSDLLKIKTNKILLLEIKDFNINIDNLLKELNKYKRNIYLMSFNNNIIKNIRLKTNKYKVGILNYVLNTIPNYSYDFIVILNDILTSNIIKTYQENNIIVFSYGIRNIKDINFKDIFYIVDDYQK